MVNLTQLTILGCRSDVENRLEEGQEPKDDGWLSDHD